MKSQFFLRSWCARHPVVFMALFAVFYMIFFSFLQKANLVSHELIRCRLDALIPFCKYAIVPYVMWFVWIPFTLFFLLRKGTRRDFWRLCLPLFFGMTFCLVLYFFFPSGLSLRPRFIPGDDIFAQAVRVLYKMDPPCNVCPSIHVLNSVTLLLAYFRCSCFRLPRRRWMRPAALLLCISIVCSTMLLKQHSVIDVVLGILLSLVLDQVAARVEGRMIARMRQRHSRETVS